MSTMLSLLILLAAAPAFASTEDELPPPTTSEFASAPAPVAQPAMPDLDLSTETTRGVHITAWAAGVESKRRAFIQRTKGTVLNTIVIAVKEMDGLVYLPGVAKTKELSSHIRAIPDPAAMLKDFKEAGFHTVARVVVFKDDHLPRIRPEWAIRQPDGTLWTNRKGVAWVDPYRKEIWEYNVDVAVRAAELGFDEIQFDYIRFPSDGDTRLCRYSHDNHTRQSAVANLNEFLAYAGKRLKLSGVMVSIAVFGMTTTAADDMGIGQDIVNLATRVDRVSPMMYPSHYGKGEYGLAWPNKEPYKVIARGLRDARLKLKDASFKLRPYLQDFSLGYHYGPAEVRAQIFAARSQGVHSWILWNPGNNYTWDALRVDTLKNFGGL